MKKKLAVLVLLFALLLPCRCLASSVQIHPPWGQDGDKLYVSAFGKDRYLIVKTKTSAAINAAIDALGAEGGEVFCPEGTYAITTQVTYDADNTTIRGTTGTIFQMGADIHGVYATNLDNIKLINIEINGNDYDQTSKYLVNFSTVETALIEGCTFYNFKNYGVSIGITHTSTRPNNGTVSNCIFRSASDTSSTALTIGSEISYGSTMNVINCTFSKCDIGIFYNNGQFLIQGCTFSTNTDDAIYSTNVYTSYYGRISNCEFFNNDARDIALADNTPIGWTISNNTFFGNDSISVYIDGYNHTVRGNVFSEPRGVSRCIEMAGSYHIVVDNTFKLEALDADYCIYLSGATGCIIANNNLDTSVTTGYTVYKVAGTDSSNVFSGNTNFTTNSVTTDADFEVSSPAKLHKESVSTKTDNYVVVKLTDLGKTFYMNSADDKTFSLPDMTAYDDGGTVKFKKMGTGKLTIDAVAGEYISDSGSGDGIFTLSTYASITLVYNHGDERWYIDNAVGTWVTYD